MKSLLSIALILITGTTMAQGKLDLYDGNKAYMDGDMDQAQQLYQRSLSDAPNQFEGTFNLGNTYYRKQDVENAIAQYQQAAETEIDPVKKAKALHNLGNTYLQSQKIDEAIDAYKSALRTNPVDDETRYNLAFAQRMKQQQEKQEQEQEQGQDQNQDNQEQQEQQDKKDQQKDEEKKDGQDEQEKEDKGEEPKEKDASDEEKKEGQEGEPKRPIEISPREAEQLLEAARNEDEKTLMQMRKQKGSDKKIEKDW
ncbi:MAG: tetratricopeptide repeat protein [Flavobacteriales bacterium]|nr:tetratricopeptide repeat protein [Flavobacteriales bacterium]